MTIRLFAAVLAGAIVATPLAYAAPVASPSPAAAPKPLNLPDVRKRVVSTLSVKSEAGLEYLISISKPDGPPPPGGFPVVYVVDGNAYAGTAAEIARLNELTLGPVVVVGIGYPTDALLDNSRRALDLTPPGPVPAAIAAAGLKTGGADVFLRFIEKKVKPAVAAECQIDGNRQVLFGHSLGGLFVIYALLAKSDAFAAYIAASPSIWWSEGIVLKPEAAFEKNIGQAKNIRVLLTAGEFERDLDPANEVKLRRIAAAHPELLKGQTVDQALDAMRAEMKHDRMIENAQGLADRLAAQGLTAKFVMFAGEDHNSEAVSAINRGIPFALGQAN